MIRIKITEKDFNELIKGKIVEQNGVQIILEDMGYVRMLEMIKKEWEKLFKRQMTD